jgi:serine/threonine protein kinase
MKPENILIKDGILKIADFGLARPTHDATLLVSNVGTPLYQSPQLLSLEKYTYKCDVWALGLIFYEVIRSFI